MDPSIEEMAYPLIISALVMIAVTIGLLRAHGTSGPFKNLSILFATVVGLLTCFWLVDHPEAVER